jgi:RimJ/RimL family protein N-acetyltransferase
MLPILETERLTLRYLQLSDAPFILELVNSPGWLRYIGDRKIHTVEQAEQYLLNGPLKSYADHGFGLCLVALRAQEGTSIGLCGLLKRDSLDHPDLGFAFLPAYTGAGYGYEIASATLAHARQQHQLTDIGAITLPTNEPSIRLLRKLGMQFERYFVSTETGDELELYRLRESTS